MSNKRYIRILAFIGMVLGIILSCLFPGDGGTVKATETPVKTYKISYIKLDVETRTPIEGAGYTLYTDEACKTKALYAQGVAIDQVFTTNEGKLIINNLLEGTYYLKETYTPFGYEVDETVYKVEITTYRTTLYNAEDGKILKELSGSPIVRDVVFNNCDTSGVALKEGEFEIYSDSTCLESVGSGIGNENGVVTIQGIRYGEYYLRQVKAPAGYNLVGKIYKVTVNEEKIDIYDGSLDTTTITNAKVGDIVLILASEDDTNTLLKGGEFGLYRDANCTELIDTTLSDNNGQIIFDVPGDKSGSYYIRQLAVPKPEDNGGVEYKMYDNRIYTAVVDPVTFAITYPNFTYEGIVAEGSGVNKVVNKPIIIVPIRVLCSFYTLEDEQLSIRDIGDEASSVKMMISAQSGTDTPNTNDKVVSTYGATGSYARADLDLDITFMPVDTIWKFEITEVEYPNGYKAEDERRETLIKVVRDEEGAVTVRYAISGSKYKILKDSTQIVFKHTRTKDYGKVMVSVDELNKPANSSTITAGSEGTQQVVSNTTTSSSANTYMTGDTASDTATQTVEGYRNDAIYTIIPILLLILLIGGAGLAAYKFFYNKEGR